MALPLQGVAPENVMHLAIGTSLAVMFFTALYTTFLRSRRGDMDWPLFWHLLAPVTVGTAIGAVAGSRPRPGPSGVLRRIRPLHDRTRPAPALPKTKSARVAGEAGTVAVMPSRASRLATGVTTGLTGALLGAGAATVTVPYLQAAGYRIQRASAVAAGLSAVIGIGAGAGYLLGGLSATGLPPRQSGYLYLPALAGMTAGALLGSPLGIAISPPDPGGHPVPALPRLPGGGSGCHAPARIGPPPQTPCGHRPDYLR